MRPDGSYRGTQRWMRQSERHGSERSWDWNPRDHRTGQIVIANRTRTTPAHRTVLLCLRPMTACPAFRFPSAEVSVTARSDGLNTGTRIPANQRNGAGSSAIHKPIHRNGLENTRTAATWFHTMLPAYHRRAPHANRTGRKLKIANVATSPNTTAKTEAVRPAAIRARGTFCVTQNRGGITTGHTSGRFGLFETRAAGEGTAPGVPRRPRPLFFAPP